MGFWIYGPQSLLMGEPVVARPVVAGPVEDGCIGYVPALWIEVLPVKAEGRLLLASHRTLDLIIPHLWGPCELQPPAVFKFL